MLFLGILLPSGVGRIGALRFDAVWRGSCRFAGPAGGGILGETRAVCAMLVCAMLDRLIAILRHVFVICAVFQEPSKSSGPGAFVAASKTIKNQTHSRRGGEKALRTAKHSFPLWPRIGRSFWLCDDTGAPIKNPPRISSVPLDVQRLLQRRIAQLQDGWPIHPPRLPSSPACCAARIA